MSEEALPPTLVNCIRDDVYPDSADVASSEVTADAANVTLNLVKREKKGLEDEIRTLSRSKASSVDDWISRARQLTADIDNAKAIAREIVRENETANGFSNKIEDAKAKHGLLRTELEFNDKVVRSLGMIQSMQLDLRLATEATTQNDFVGASARILKAEKALEQHGSALGLNTVEILGRKLSNARDWTINGLQTVLSSIIKFGYNDGTSKTTLSCYEQAIVFQKSYRLDQVVDALENLEALDSTLNRLSSHIERRLLHPVLMHSQLEHTAIRQQKDDLIESHLEHGAGTLSNVVDSLSAFSDFLRTSIPDPIGSGLAKRLIPNVVDSVINEWLTPALPLKLSNLHEFDVIQSIAQKLSNSLPQAIRQSQRQLADWVDRTPRLWISKRRTAVLDDVRAILRASKGESKIVERIEKQKVSKHEEAFASNTATGEWDVEWGDDEDAQESTLHGRTTETVDDEDESGWGFDDSTEKTESSLDTDHTEQVQKDANDEDDAWGWGDEANGNDDEPTTSNQLKVPLSKAVNGHRSGQRKPDDSEREIVLKETYAITDIPEKILDTIKQQVEDAIELRNMRDTILDKATSSAALLTLPTLMLAMFRATASAFYTSGLQSGQMHLYNDCMFLASQLQDLASQQPELSRLANDIPSLEKYAKSAYAQEMDTQRIILGDLLDGAQGFSSCTQQPFAAECETAVSSTVERLRLLHKEWQNILSHSALMQSIGSLLARVIDKITRDIEDMEDISDPESQRLAGFCNQVAELEDLFLPPNAAALQDQGQDVVPLTAVYVSNWLRFRYLAEILESKLVDIKYLWTEGELSLEFSTEEIVDLIKALFADSHHRKEAVAEIRRHAR